MLDKTKRKRKRIVPFFIFIYRVDMTKRNKKGLDPSLLFCLFKKWPNLSICVWLTFSNWAYYHPHESPKVGVRSPNSFKLYFSKSLWFSQVFCKFFQIYIKKKKNPKKLNFFFIAQFNANRLPQKKLPHKYYMGGFKHGKLDCSCSF